MSIFGKLMFWKRSGDDLGLGDELALPKGGFPSDDIGLGSPQSRGLPSSPQGFQEPRIESFDNARIMNQPQPYLQQQQPQSYGYGYNKDLELISAKLDSLRATLDNINQRIANLERVAYGEDDRRRGW